MNRIIYLLLTLVAAGLSACGGGSGAAPKDPVAGNPAVPPVQPSPWAYQACESAGDPAPAETNAAVDGIWQGTLTNELTKTTEPWSAIVAADGRFHLLSSGATQMAGTLEVDGNGYTGDGIARSGGQLWNDRTLFSALSVAGSIAERERLDGDFVLASGDAGCVRFAYDAERYERPSSLDLVAGRWLEFDGWWPTYVWVALDVTNEGALTGGDIYGCEYAGSIALQDEAFNLYALALDITQRAGDPNACWIAGSYQGLAYLEDSSDGSNVNHYLRLVFAHDDNAISMTVHR